MTSKEEILELLNDFAEACGMASEGRNYTSIYAWDGQEIHRIYEDKCEIIGLTNPNAPLRR